MIKRAQERQILFVAVTMDDLYRRNETLRQNLNEAGIEYYGDIPANTKVYLEKSQIIHSLTKLGKPSKAPQIIGTAYGVCELRQKNWVEWHKLRSRASERGYLGAKFARVRVWVVYSEETRQEWMLIRQGTAHFTYVLSNAYETDLLPILSVANVRELLRASMPLPQLSPEDAADLVVNHLVNRMRSRKSRLRHRRNRTDS